MKGRPCSYAQPKTRAALPRETLHPRTTEDETCPATEGLAPTHNLRRAPEEDPLQKGGISELTSAKEGNLKVNPRGNINFNLFKTLYNNNLFIEL